MSNINGSDFDGQRLPANVDMRSDQDSTDNRRWLAARLREELTITRNRAQICLIGRILPKIHGRRLRRCPRTDEGLWHGGRGLQAQLVVQRGSVNLDAAVASNLIAGAASVINLNGIRAHGSTFISIS